MTGNDIYIQGCIRRFLKSPTASNTNITKQEWRYILKIQHVSIIIAVNSILNKDNQYTNRKCKYAWWNNFIKWNTLISKRINSSNLS